MGSALGFDLRGNSNLKLLIKSSNNGILISYNICVVLWKGEFLKLQMGTVDSYLERKKLS